MNNNSSSGSITATTITPTLTLDTTPSTPNNNNNNEDSTNDSDSEMLPVKQELVELKGCEEFETDGEPFNPEAYLKEGVTLTTTASTSDTPGTVPPPPPPGPLRPSYIPPPPIKAQEGKYLNMALRTLMWKQTELCGSFH